MHPFSSSLRGAVAAAALVAAAFVIPAFAATTTIKGEVVDLECSLGKGAAGKGEAHARLRHELRQRRPGHGHPDRR